MIFLFFCLLVLFGSFGSFSNFWYYLEVLVLFTFLEYNRTWRVDLSFGIFTVYVFLDFQNFFRFFLHFGTYCIFSNFWDFQYFLEVVIFFTCLEYNSTWRVDLSFDIFISYVFQNCFWYLLAFQYFFTFLVIIGNTLVLVHFTLFEQICTIFLFLQDLKRKIQF